MTLPFKMISQSLNLVRLGEMLESSHEMLGICKKVRASLNLLVKIELFSKRRYLWENESRRKFLLNAETFFRIKVVFPHPFS